jgi:muramoyltetrapeptide carboxypeptidase
MSLTIKLDRGDRVLVICPGSAPDFSRLYPSLEIIKSWGLEVDFNPDSVQSADFFSNSDRFRAHLLWKAVTSKKHKMIWFARGGYGSARLVPLIIKKLSRLKVPIPKKIFWGLSDVTVLLNFFAHHPKFKGSCVVHGPLLEKLSELEADNQEEVRKVLFDCRYNPVFSGLSPLNRLAQKTKALRAPCFGGNLSLIQTSLGTPMAWKAKDKLIFLEDIGERGYRIDRMLVHLRQAGFFTDCSGVILGDFIGGDEPSPLGDTRVNLVARAIEIFSSEVNFPVWKGIESGHGLVQRPLVLGKKMSLIRTGSEFLLRS